MNQERFKWIVGNLDFDRLTDWEIRFLGDMERKINAGRDIGERCEEILERIHADKQ